MLDELTRKQLAVEHCLRVNARDVDGLLKLYSPRIRFEDPVGSGVKIGHQALREHAAGAIHCDVHEFAHPPIAAPDGRQVAIPVTAHLNYQTTAPLLAGQGFMDWDGHAAPGQRLQIHYVMVLRVGAAGLIEEMRAYWGKTDVSVVDETAVLTMQASV